jgi:hypothetical protein
MEKYYILHFLFSPSGKPSPDPQHPDYVPSIFSYNDKCTTEQGKKKLLRYERTAKRMKHDTSIHEASCTDNGNLK